MPTDEVHDDPTISDDERLWRRVFPAAVHENEEPGGELRAQSGAFRDHRGPLSVDIGSLTTPDEVLGRAPGMRLAEFNAKVAREAGCKIQRDRLPDNRAHALIYGDGANGSLTSRQAKAIAHRSRIIPLHS